jgi:hypothetical protein
VSRSGARKRIACATARIRQRKRQPVDVRARGFHIDAAAEALAHERLGHGAVRRAQRRQDRIRQAPDRDDRFGETPFAARVIGGKAIEPRKKRGHGPNHQHRLGHERPRDQPAAGEAFAGLACNAKRQGPSFVRKAVPL